MFELGTHKTKLYRSSRNEWFGGTEGFYWGCNNAKDLTVRSEYTPDPNGQPEDLPFVPGDRDRKWMELYDRYKGSIDEQFGFLAFRTAPLVSNTTVDAKIATAEMAKSYMMWAVFGKPNEREWLPSSWQKEQFPGNEGIHSSGYRMIAGQPSDSLAKIIVDREGARKAPPAKDSKKDEAKGKDWKPIDEDRLWKGWILPAEESDRWLTAGGATYRQVLRAEDLEKELESWRVRYRAATVNKDAPLRQTAFDFRSSAWYDASRSKGVLLLDAMRRKMGDEKFLTFMRDFYGAQTTKSVRTADFVAAAEKADGASLQDFFSLWLDKPGLPGDRGGSVYSPLHLRARLPEALIVYGTEMDAGSNRYAAERIQHDLLDWYESAVPIRKDFELTPEDARSHTLILVGRPETNSALRVFAPRVGVAFNGASFAMEGKSYAAEDEGLVFVAQHPDSPNQMVVMFAGNSALQTVRLTQLRTDGYAYQVYRGTSAVDKGFPVVR
jgi:hypothetical protein